MHLQQNELNKCVSWFYWIGGLSIINTLIIQFDGNISFVVGLGITQFFDGIALGLRQQEAAGEWIRYAVAGTNIIISLVFISFGIAGKKLLRGVYIAGLILYGLDTLLFLAFADYFSLGFHVLALFFLVKGVGKMNELKSRNSDSAFSDTAPMNMNRPEVSP